ncbi:MAG: ATP-binding protein [Rubrobacteraceae bacterium]
MSLRRKLVVTFGGLGFMTLMVAVITVWSMMGWSDSEQELREHYQRSLLLQEVRARSSQAFLEVPEGLTGNDPDARRDFEETLEPAGRFFDQWADLADNESEFREVEEVRSAYRLAVDGANEAFSLIEEENFEEGETLFDELEDNEFENFQQTALQAARDDSDRRQEIRDNTENTRRTAQTMLAISSFGALSLVLLLAGYLASDLFTPLRDIRSGLKSVRNGDRHIRLTEERSDEIGDINREFNRMVAAVSRRERNDGTTASTPIRENGGGAVEGGDSFEETARMDLPTRVALHRMISDMREEVGRVGGNGHSAEHASARLEEMAREVSRLADFSYPMDLELERTDVRALVYGVVQRFQRRMIESSVSLEVDVSPEVRHAVADRLKLREAVCELLGNSLDAIPDRGGRIGLRVRADADDGGHAPNLLIEVADDGAGADQSLIDRSFDRGESSYSGLAMVRAVVKQHGGSLEIESEPGEGTYAQIRIPLRD